MVRDYFEIDYEIIWKIKQEKPGDLVDLIDTLTDILAGSDEEDYYDLHY